MKFWRPIHFLLNALKKSENSADRLIFDSIRLARPNTAQWSPPIPALVDTGSSDLMLPIGLARKLGLPIGNLTPAKFANGQLTQVPTVMADVNFAGLQLANVACGIGPDEVPLLVGMNVLRYFDMNVRDGRARFTLNDEAVTNELQAYVSSKADDEEE